MTAEIDDSLYSRQRYVLGDGAMHKLGRANVLLIGVGGVGIEIAKNVILAGVKSFALYDKRKCNVKDLGVQFYINENDVEKNLKRDEASLSKLSELNPYVTVCIENGDILNDYSLLQKYQCVVVTEETFDVQKEIDNYCRSQTPPIPFISADVIGLFSYIFCDFGNSFEVFDKDGEESREVLIKNITNSKEGVIETLDYIRHDLETGDFISIKEVNGMEEVNNKVFKITCIDPYSFSIDCDTSSFHKYERNGMFKKVKTPNVINFKSLENQLYDPDVIVNDFSKMDSPVQNLISIHALKRLFKNKDISFDNLLNEANQIKSSFKQNIGDIEKDILNALWQTYKGQLSPLCAAIGGIVAQEVLIAVSGKFSPLKQWLLLDAIELLPKENRSQETTNEGRYSYMKSCLDETLVEKLLNAKLFMVGCGAIGCEMLKNISLLGIGCNNGNVTITDHDLIEKSNLNRQFLFRSSHIQKSKSTVAGDVAKGMNKDMNIRALVLKVSPETEKTVFSDAFFTEQDIVVNALDNVAARKYIDGRCVSNARPLIETGTMGPKGHVQVIVPHLTETYASQQDPIDAEVPYCTLKSFPQSIEHTIQWARDKFESLFNMKPTNFNKFWKEFGNVEAVKQNVTIENPPDGFVDTVKLLMNKPKSWASCVEQARLKFESFFNHKALQLLHVFPLDSKMADGSLFWQSPKRPPNPVSFNIKDQIHMQFVVSYARLMANSYSIAYSEKDYSMDSISKILDSVKVKTFKPSSKVIVTDESQIQKDVSAVPVDENKTNECFKFLQQFTEDLFEMVVQPFEKDDDSNAHIDFITAASNLRATMYDIENADRYETKRIAGRIIPAIATTTAAIAGLATIELLKVLASSPVEKLKNCFLNLALPVMVLSEPGVPPTTKITDKLHYTPWDRWDVRGNPDYTLADFSQHFKVKYGLTLSMVCEGVKMIYAPFMPGHKKRLGHTMVKLLKPQASTHYIDLIIAFDPVGQVDTDSDDLPAPPVRYYFR